MWYNTITMNITVTDFESKLKDLDKRFSIKKEAHIEGFQILFDNVFVVKVGSKHHSSYISEETTRHPPCRGWKDGLKICEDYLGGIGFPAVNS